MEIPFLLKEGKESNIDQSQTTAKNNHTLKISTTEEDLQSFPSTKAETKYSSLLNQGKSLLRENLGSGVTVGLVNLPLSISLAVAAGGTPQAGVTTAMISGFCSGIFGGSNYNVVGPTGALAGFLLKANIYFTAAYGVNCLPLLSIFSGLVMLISVVGNFQKIIDFIPSSVTEGFTLGVSLILALGQVNNLLGLNLPKTECIIEGTYQSLQFLHEANLYSFLIGTVFVVVLMILVKKFPRVPWVAILTVIGILIGALLKISLASSPLPLLSDSFPSLSFEGYFSSYSFPFEIMVDGRFYADLFPIAFVSILESLISAKIADKTTNTSFHPKQEVIGLAISNCIGGLLGGIPSTAALARTRLNILSGCTHKISALINSITVALITICLFSFFKYLPLCVIASSVIYVALRMVDFHEIVVLYKSEKDQFLIILLVAVVSLFLDSTYGVLAGMFVFLVIFFGKFLHPQSDILLPKDEHPNREGEHKSQRLLSSPGGPGIKRKSRNFTVTLTNENGKLRLRNLISHESIIHNVNEESTPDANEVVQDDDQFCLYKFMGVVNFLNINSHLKNIEEISQHKNIILSFRYCVSFDTAALHSLEKAFNDLIKKGRVIFLAFVSPQLLEKFNVVCGEEWVEQLKSHKKLFVFDDE